MPEAEQEMSKNTGRQINLFKKKRILALLIVLAVIPLTVILALTQQRFYKSADGAALIDSIEVHPGKIYIDVDENPVQMSALVYDVFGEPVIFGATYSWSMSSANSVGTLTSTEGDITEFTPLEIGCGEITVQGMVGIDTAIKTIPITVYNDNNIPSCSNENARVIDRVEIYPGEISTYQDYNFPVNMSALSIDESGEPIYFNVAYEWSMSSTNSVGDLSDSTGDLNSFLPSREGFGEITVVATYDGKTVTKTVPVEVKSPIVTPSPSPMVLRFSSIKLHGIGSGGDNTNPNLPGNPNPTRTTREINIDLENSDGFKYSLASSSVSFNTSTGDFSGDVELEESIPEGNYLIKVKSPQFLKKQLSGVFNISQNIIIDIPTFSLITGDINNDNSLSLTDYNMLIDCYSDLLPAKNCADEDKKISADLSDDGEVNADDYNLFLRELSVASGD